MWNHKSVLCHYDNTLNFSRDLRDYQLNVRLGKFLLNLVNVMLKQLSILEQHLIENCSKPNRQH